MEEILQELLGKTVDVSCDNAAVYRGEVIEIRAGVLSIRDDDSKVLFINIGKIIFVCEANSAAVRPGFIV